ncbi:hypothetical protein K6U20_01220 [Vibrio fluvialis]|uniref:hypothetical protein n=1 Tax=Vibrio fluvialis TaxID=676 RepID=UPI001EEB653A|nr:hypothetical protein [Vibrio fluvialis]MCG6403253.1 hypothetical protein [Vibrio fluvialis]
MQTYNKKSLLVLATSLLIFGCQDEAYNFASDSDTSSQDTSDGSTSTSNETSVATYDCSETDETQYDIVLSQGYGDNAYQLLANGSGDNVLLDTDSFADALAEAYLQMPFSSDSDATTIGSILIAADGTMSADLQLKVPSYTVLNVCSTITASDDYASGDKAVIYARERTNISIPNLTLAGSPRYGIFMRSVSNIELGNITMALDKTPNILDGVRIDNNPGKDNVRITNVTADVVNISGTTRHAFETYGVDGLTIDSFVASNTGYSGLMLNDTVNAEINTLTCTNCADASSGYAALRIANNAGLIDNEWPEGNIHVKSMTATDGDRGIFAVSNSGGLTIDSVMLTGQNQQAILIQSSHNIVIASDSGTITDQPIYITTQSGYDNASDITFSNLTLEGTAYIQENSGLCSDDLNNRAQNIAIAGAGSVTMCFSD